jgi:hypothetical protein
LADHHIESIIIVDAILISVFMASKQLLCFFSVYYLNQLASFHFRIKGGKEARFVLGGRQELNPCNWDQIGPDTAFALANNANGTVIIYTNT